MRGFRIARGAVFGALVGAALLTAPLWARQAQAQEGCASPQEKCGAILTRECLSSLGAGVMALGEARDCRRQMDDYRACLSEVAASCPRASVQQDATAESNRFEALARLGGLIETPESAVEFYNNALVYGRRGDQLNGRKMLEKAIAAGADQIDVHQRYVQLLKAQEGLIGAREIMADLTRRAPENKGAALAEATLRPAREREAALRALAEGADPFEPAYFEIAALFSPDRVGDQSRSDQRAEKAALEAFTAADEKGRIYRWFLDKDAVEFWREAARRRLAVYQNRNLDVQPVSLIASASNDSWIISLQILESARKIRYRVDGGEIRDTGATAAVNPQTGAPVPRSFFHLPLGTERAAIEVWYDNIRGDEEGPFALSFNAVESFTRNAKQVLGALTQKWVQDRAWTNGSQLVYFTQIASHSCGLKKVEYGVEQARPDTEFPLGACDPKNPHSVGDAPQLYLSFEKPVSLLSVRLTYADGETSEDRQFRFDQ